MLGLALALILIGIVFSFLVLFWVGIPIGLAGIVLFVLYLFGFGRRVANRHQETGP